MSAVTRSRRSVRGATGRHLRRMGLGLTALLLLSPAGRAAGAYDEIIAPIFQARCVECHGEQKQKAKLALHNWEGLIRGSDGGPVIMAGRPGESVLLQRLQLPVSDDDHMPPAEHAQPGPEEVALVARWIEKGATRTATLRDLELSTPLAAAARDLPARLAALRRPAVMTDAPWELNAVAVERARAPRAAAVLELQRRFPGALSYESRTSAALHFTAAGFGTAFGDAELAALKSVARDLTSVDLSRTSITDQSAGVLVGMANLRVLRASATKLGDATVAQLAALPKLESLALSDTQVTAASVAVLSRVRSLRALHVAGTAAERPAQSANLPVGPSAADLLPPVAPETTAEKTETTAEKK
jgi:hypothetical protein